MHLERKLGSSFWEKIDWVAGTSTGGILALALAKSIENAIFIKKNFQNVHWKKCKSYICV